MKNRGIARGRMFSGATLLAAAVTAWGTALGLSQHGPSTAEGTEHVRDTVFTLLRNSAILTLILAALAGWLIFGTRRPKKPLLDGGAALVLLFLVGSSLYQLVWLYTSVK